MRILQKRTCLLVKLVWVSEFLRVGIAELLRVRIAYNAIIKRIIHTNRILAERHLSESNSKHM